MNDLFPFDVFFYELFSLKDVFVENHKSRKDKNVFISSINVLVYNYFYLLVILSKNTPVTHIIQLKQILYIIVSNKEVLWYLNN
jgi:hypothetical protein